LSDDKDKMDKSKLQQEELENENQGNRLDTTSSFWDLAAERQRELFSKGVKPAYIFIDLENFRFISMRGDISEGARLLNEVSRLIHEEFPDALITRGASIQFVVLTGVSHLGERLLRLHDKARAIRKENKIDMKAGVYVADDSSVAPMMACDYAKAACANIKETYNEVYRVYDEELHNQLVISNYITTKLDEAISHHDIKVFFQPIVRTLTRRACAAEALARWDDPKYGTLVPNTFIVPLEATHLITKLDLYVAEEVCRQYKSLQRNTGVNLPISINFSRIDFTTCNIREKLDAFRKKYDVPEHCIYVEITERAFGEDLAILKDQIRDLRSHGYEVWMDDFGSGFSSLSLLKDLDVDLVKFDLRFLVGSANVNRGDFILGVLIGMVKQLGMKTLVEGVETEDQLEFLQSVGCERVQGYLYSKPVPYNDLMKLSIWNTDENPMNKKYYNTVGCCNMHQTVPETFSKEWDDTRSIPSMPATIVEYRNGKISLLSANGPFIHTMGPLTYQDVKACDAFLARMGGSFHRSLLQGIHKSLLRKERVVTEAICNNEFCTFTVEPIAHNEGTGADALLVIMTNVSPMGFKDTQATVQSVLNGVFSVFDSLYMFNLSRKTVHRVKASSTRDDGLDQLPLSVFIREWAARYVYPSDRERFFAFYDLESMVERLHATGEGYISGLFRVIRTEQSQKNGWQMHLLWLVSDGDEVKVHCGTIDIVDSKVRTQTVPALDPMKVVSSADHTGAMIVPGILWKSMQDIPGMYIYWKDTKGRFIGTNKEFLDYFNIASFDDIAGKTEEELGWKVELNPNYREEDLLNGKKAAVVAEKGHCLSSGEIRNIVMNKIPLVVGNQLIGILSWFRDSTQDAMAEDTLRSFARKDELTGALNYHGLQNALKSYEESYQKRGIDFVLMYIDLDHFKQCNDEHDHAFGNHVLQLIVQRMQQALDRAGVVARMGGDEFVILKQVTKAGADRKLRSVVEGAFRGPLEVDGIVYQPQMSMGTADYSETRDTAELMKLADKRMYEEKRKRHQAMAAQEEA
jgi:diguanylate cyclase (GGDEF)-like protein